MLLELGAEVNARVDGRMSIEAAIDALSFGLDSIFQYSSQSENRRTDAIACIEVLAQAGARWNPADPRTISSFRRTLGAPSEALRFVCSSAWWRQERWGRGFSEN
jgi:hypothetical protein